MTLLATLDFLKTSRKSKGFTAWHQVRDHPADLCDIPQEIHPALKQVLIEMDITLLYRHQHRTFELANNGKNVVIATPTASGKTWCYNLFTLNEILRNPRHRALYLFPTKALAQDQLHELRSISKCLKNTIIPAVYDGDTPGDARKTIRRTTHVLLTNPDMLHAGILPHHTKWRDFFENLKVIVIDELHHYRGVFGSHFCNVLRRLGRICKFYGSDPQFILCSATLANPAELASGMIDQPVTLVDQSGSPSGEKHVIFYNPPLVDPMSGIRRSYIAETIEFARICVTHDVQTIVFTRSRRNVEIIVREMKRILKDTGEGGIIRGYRGGYLPRERREIETELRRGQVRCVVATSALELGIDIGDLDMVILAGYPGTIASTWQRAGRSGRREDISAAILVASSSPLDQFMVRNPEYFFQSSPEFGLINPDNLLIQLDHIRCSVYELPFQENEPFSSHSDTEQFLKYLENEQDVRKTQNQWFYCGGRYPAERISLRSISPENYLISDVSGSRSRVIAELDGASAFYLIHPEAVYMHEGRQYYVETLDLQRHHAAVRPLEADYYTVPLEQSSVRVLEHHQSTDDPFPANLGEVRVLSQVVGFKKLRFHNMENLGGGSLDLPEQELITTGFWLTLPLDISGPETQGDFKEIAGGLVGALSAMHSTASVLLMSDPRDIGSCVSGLRGNWSARMTPLGTIDISATSPEIAMESLVNLFIYDRYPGGIGLAGSLFDRYAELVKAAESLVKSCPCHSGCPGCIGPIITARSNAKEQARLILGSIRTQTA